MFGFFSKKKTTKPKAKAKKKAGSKKAASSVASPKKPTAAGKSKQTASKSPVSEDNALIRDAVRQAVDEDSSLPRPRADLAAARLSKNPQGPQTEREKIIAQALAIQKSQSRLLDDLDPKVKAKVQRMAVDLMIKPNRKPDA